MSYTPLKIYRWIPLGLFFLCVIYGIYNLEFNTPDNFIAGHLVIFLGMVCFTIFCVASLMTGQIIRGSQKFDNYFYPLLAYLGAFISMGYGIYLFNINLEFYKVSGHQVFGLGLICFCIATEAAVYTRFVNIKNNMSLSLEIVSPDRFSVRKSQLFIILPIIVVALGWFWVIYLLLNFKVDDNFIPGHVVAGMSMICTCVLAAIINSLKQINNTYTWRDKKIWPVIGAIMGLISLSWGIGLILVDINPATYLSPGFILIGISCVCFSIFAKMLLTSQSWRNNFIQTPIIPFIPLFLVLSCFFLSFFLFQWSVGDQNLFIPARVLVGLGSVCFSLYSVISIIAMANSPNLEYS